MNKKPIKISVTADDIMAAKLRKSNPDLLRTENCPIALAAKRRLHRPVKAQKKGIRIKRNGRWQYRAYPPSAREFVHRVDYGHSVEPFEFEI